MKIHVKLSLDDVQLNNVKRNLTGKDIKAKATRAEVCELVNDLLEAFTSPPSSRAAKPETKADRRREERDEINQNLHRQTAGEFCSDDCCRRNDLLQSRVNRLQFLLDTNPHQPRR